MTKTYWAWRVTFHTTDAPGETFVVAASREDAQQSVAATVGDIESIDVVEQCDGIPATVAEQHFDGYCPRIRAVFSSMSYLTRKIRPRYR